MGNFFVEITIINSEDITRFKDGNIAESQIRQVTLSALVDTGATTLMISEETFKQLGLRTMRPYEITIAGGGKLEGAITSAVTICWKDRITTVEAVMMPGNTDIDKPFVTLLGAVPLEMMDLIVDPSHLQLVGRHGDKVVGIAM